MNYNESSTVFPKRGKILNTLNDTTSSSNNYYVDSITGYIDALHEIVVKKIMAKETK